MRFLCTPLEKEEPHDQSDDKRTHHGQPGVGTQSSPRDEDDHENGDTDEPGNERFHKGRCVVVAAMTFPRSSRKMELLGDEALLRFR